jgi:aminomethyltransferase
VTDSAANAPRPTPLREAHRDAGGRLVDFAGWELPVQFDGIQAEHRRVREEAGLFDVSHMGRVTLTGPGTAAFLDGLLPYDISRLRDGRMAYTVLCNDDGGAIDDLAVYRVSANEYRLVINASRTSADLAVIESRAASTPDITIEETTATQAMIAVQGPQAERLVNACVGEGAADLGFFRFGFFDGRLVSRSGYTGEDGFEITCPATDGPALWQELVSAGGHPTGLAARDTLRLEAGLCLYGNELDESTTPIEAGLSWTLALDKATPFPGQEALRQQQSAGPSRRLVGLRLEGKGIPRAHQEVVHDGRVVGQVTSGTHSPSLGQGIAMAYVSADVADDRAGVEISSRGRTLPATIVELPFLPSRVKRRRPRTARST